MLYFFDLRTPEETIRDPEGTDLDDDSSAQEHARTVASELMRNCEPLTRSWRLEVRDSTGRRCFDQPFATVDASAQAVQGNNPIVGKGNNPIVGRSTHDGTWGRWTRILIAI
jgi:hypothetical protein